MKRGGGLLYVNRRRRGGDEMISEGDEGADFIGWGLGLCVGFCERRRVMGLKIIWVWV